MGLTPPPRFITTIKKTDKLVHDDVPKGRHHVPKRLFFYSFYKPGGGSNPFIKNYVPLLFCSVGRLKTGRKTTENRQKLAKTTRKTTETGTNFYKKRGGGGQRNFIKTIKNRQIGTRWRPLGVWFIQCVHYSQNILLFEPSIWNRYKVCNYTKLV